MTRRAYVYLCISVWLFVVISSCTADGDELQERRDGAVDADGGVVAEGPYLGLNQPKDGFQVRSVGAEIQPGEDVEYCEIARLPGDPSDTYYVKALELGNAANSHHLIVTAATPGGPAERKFEEVGVGKRVECLSASQRFGEVGLEGVGGSQHPYEELVLPQGVGQKYHGGQLIAFDYHYLNTHDEAVSARSAVNFHLTDASSVERLAHSFGFRNYTFATPPRESASFTAECHFRADVMLSRLTRHTHRWGTDFTVWFSGGPRDGEAIWTTNDWQHDVEYEFDTPVRMRAGEGLRFRCRFQNDTDRVLRFGTSATDEMCILFGTVWEAEVGQELGRQSCDIVWNDAQGIGHPADEAGGFPAATPQEAQLCLANAADTACAECRCNSCATPAIRCATDAECGAVLDCYAGCTPDVDCNAACQSTIDKHSSSVGPLTQMTTCFNDKCRSVCQAR